MVSEDKPGPDRRDGALWMSAGRVFSRQHGLCKGPWATWCLAVGGEGTLRTQGVGGAGDEHTGVVGVGTRLNRWSKTLSQSLIVCCPNCWTPTACGRKAQFLPPCVSASSSLALCSGPRGLQQAGPGAFVLQSGCPAPFHRLSAPPQHTTHTSCSVGAEPGLKSWSPQSGDLLSEKQL